MRKISADLISEVSAELAQKANFVLRPDVLAALKVGLKKETDKSSRKILKAIIENASVAKKDNLAICQDTGMAVVFVEIGQQVCIIGGLLSQAINRGIYSGYREASLRNSIIANPLLRGASDFGPALIHTDIVPGDKLKLTVLPKGFGCENKGAVKMFNPTAGLPEIKEFIVDTVRSAGPDACPPFVLGVGIGGTQNYACLLAKKALLRKITKRALRLETELLKEINKLNIGPMGLGGRTTCLGVNIETYPTHIAGLPVAVNISCHALRSASKTI